MRQDNLVIYIIKPAKEWLTSKRKHNERFTDRQKILIILRDISHAN